ncbi:MAG: cytochrome c [Ignavibacteria bacterium]|nr:cytochrome c [Ignavibacteria bacterium]
MKKIFNPLVPLTLGALFVLGFSFNSFDDPDGKKLFEDNKCNLCHSVSTVGIEAEKKAGKMAGGDLIDLADSYEADWIVKYVKKETEKEGKSHKKPFKGTDEELQALVDWLLEQKAEE